MDFNDHVSSKDITEDRVRFDCRNSTASFPYVLLSEILRLSVPHYKDSRTRPDEYIQFVSSNLSSADELKFQLLIKVEQK